MLTKNITAKIPTGFYPRLNNTNYMAKLKSANIAQRFAQILEYLNIEHKLSQREIAQKVGTTPQTITNIKLGKNMPAIDVFQKIWVAFPELNPEYMLFEDVPMLRIELKQEPGQEQKNESMEQIMKENDYLKKIVNLYEQMHGKKNV